MPLKAPRGRKRGERRLATPGRILHDQAVRRSRDARLYADFGAPDTVEGRFELLTLHVILLIDRLHALGEEGDRLGQALFDTYIGDLDGALREMGVGDLSVGRRMKSLAQAFYGRAKATSAAFAALPDASALEAMLARTVGPRNVPALAAYVAARRSELASMDMRALLAPASV